LVINFCACAFQNKVIQRSPIWWHKETGFEKDRLFSFQLSEFLKYNLHVWINILFEFFGHFVDFSQQIIRLIMFSFLKNIRLLGFRAKICRKIILLLSNVWTRFPALQVTRLLYGTSCSYHTWAEWRGDPAEQAASPYMDMSRVDCMWSGLPTINLQPILICKSSVIK
jgi:hypothetical protein